MVGRYRALLIGNSTYALDAHNLQPLRGPVKDIAALHAALVDRRCGLFADDDVTLVAEVTSDRALRAMSRFFSGADRDDVCLLYFSGHGKLDQLARLHLCMQDTDVTDLLSTAVSSVRINEFIEACRARTVVVVLDCCHAGAFRGGDFGDAVAGPGRYVMTSCRSTQLANDATSENGTSYFTQHLVDGLVSEVATDDDGFVRFSDLYTYVNRTLRTEGKQIPQQRVSGDGELRLARRARDPADSADPPTRPPPPVRVQPQPREAGPPPWWRRRRTAVVGGVLAVLVAAAVTTVVLLGSRETGTPSTTAGSGTYTANGAWRLRMDATGVAGCTIDVTNTATGEAVPIPIGTAYSVARIQIPQAGTYRWRTNDRGCHVTEFAGSGNATLPFLQEDNGDTDAFTAPPGGVPVAVLDNKDSNCTLRLFDAATGEELDVNEWKAGAGAVTLHPNGRDRVYIFDDNCVIRVGAP